MSQPLSRERREAVLSRAEVVGVEAAAREAGVQPTTLQRWRRRAEARAAAVEGERVGGELVTPEPVLSDLVEDEDDDEDLDEQERLRRAARAFSRTADRARRRLDEIIPQSRSVQQLGIVLGIGTDKAAMVKRLLEEEDEQQRRLGDDQAEMIVTVLQMFLRAVGVPITDAGRTVMRGLLGRATTGDVLVADPADAEQAAAEVFAHFERRVLRRLEEERRALPAGPDEDAEVQVQEADVVVVQPLPDEEVVEAEVVDDRSIAEQAREMTERIMEKMRAEQAEQEGFGVGVHVSRGGGFDMPRGLA